jgi:ferredoxin
MKNFAPLKHPTQRFIAEGRRLPDYSFFDLMHGLVYGFFPYLYIGIGKGEHPLGKVGARVWGAWRRVFPSRSVEGNTTGNGFADTYHGKTIPLEVARQLVSIKQDLTISYPEQVIPYNLARELILHDPDHIIALDCPCRVSKQNPCQPVDVCLIVGEPFASLVADRQPGRSKWISPARAREILEEEEQRGHVHHAFFKDAMLGRFYAICNCCACCCGAMQAQRNGTPMLASSGYLSRVDESRCQGCGTCVEYCQFTAISIVDDHSTIDEVMCMGCGVCVSHCPNGALQLELAPWKGAPMTLPEEMVIF